jgi:hypothetical protein
MWHALFLYIYATLKLFVTYIFRLGWHFEAGCFYERAILRSCTYAVWRFMLYSSSNRSKVQSFCFFFVGYFTTLSIPVSIQLWMENSWLMNCKGFWRTRLLYNRGTGPEFARRCSDKQRKVSVRMVADPDKIRTIRLGNTSLGFYCHSCSIDSCVTPWFVLFLRGLIFGNCRRLISPFM